LNGLDKCVATNVPISSSSELAVWKLAKDKDKRLFQTNQRPIPQGIIDYCVGDVQYLTELRERFWARQAPGWRET
jgi:exonuclease 3'-5' domain-containing protein 1